MAIGESFAGPTDQRCHHLSDAESSLFEAAIMDAIRSQPRGIVQRLRESLSSLSSRRRMVTLAGLFALLMFWPTTIRIVADGRVVPRSQHVVYSPVNGEIERIDCETGTKVAAQQVLCTFSSHELDRDLSRLRGEALTVREQLRIATTRRGEDSAKEISSDRRVLEVRLRGLEQQLEQLEERQANLVVRSPIAGVVSLVAPDDLGSLAAGRPIQVGQSVIRVIDADAGYRVELEIPDEEIGYVVDAMNRQERKPVKCRFRIRSDPEVERSGELIKLEQTATPNRLGQWVVLGKVDPTDRNAKFASESGVTGWVECNRSAAGFVLFRKVIERLRIAGWL
jgi:multidrug efflux pump subunit AcrA (membrane-fusion protein)